MVNYPVSWYVYVGNCSQAVHQSKGKDLYDKGTLVHRWEVGCAHIPFNGKQNEYLNT